MKSCRWVSEIVLHPKEGNPKTTSAGTIVVKSIETVLMDYGPRIATLASNYGAGH